MPRISGLARPTDVSPSIGRGAKGGGRKSKTVEDTLPLWLSTRGPRRSWLRAKPILSVKTKKKELLGTPPGMASQLVNIHNFIDPKLSPAVPCCALPTCSMFCPREWAQYAVAVVLDLFRFLSVERCKLAVGLALSTQ